LIAHAGQAKVVLPTVESAVVLNKKAWKYARSAEYPCQHIQAMAEHYPTLIQDGKSLQKIGIEKWISEQLQRAKRGFAYADLRYPR
jgi:hypothetical protein